MGTMGRALIAIVLLSLLFICCIFESFLVCIFCRNQMDGNRDEAAAIEEGSNNIMRQRQRMTRLIRYHRNFITVWTSFKWETWLQIKCLSLGVGAIQIFQSRINHWSMIDTWWWTSVDSSCYETRKFLCVTNAISIFDFSLFYELIASSI